VLIVLDELEIEDLGRAGRVTSSKESTLIVDGKGNKKALDARISHIRKELAATESEFDKEKLQERLAKLTGGVAPVGKGIGTSS
jgi:chaperonin GroEL